MSERKTWLITGCSSGLGRELSQALLAGNDNLVLTARNPDKLSDLIVGHEDRAIAMQLDVTSSNQADHAVARAIECFGRIDVLVNNAGYGHLGTIEDVPLDAVRRLFEVDFFGLVRLVQAVLPAMRERRSGRIVNIASVGGLIGFPASGHYCAAKFAVVGLSEALHAEVEPYGIDVMAVEPGPFNTDFSNRSLMITPPSTSDYDFAAMFERAGISEWASKGEAPAAGVAALLEAIELEKPPLHLVLGREGVEVVLQRTRARLEEYEKWADFGRLSRIAKASPSAPAMTVAP